MSWLDLALFMLVALTMAFIFAAMAWPEGVVRCIGRLASWLRREREP